MLNKIDTALRELIASELGYTVDPSVESFTNLRDDEFPVCLVQYGDETASDLQTIGNYTNDLEVTYEIIVMSDESTYRFNAFEQLTRFKKFINEARNLIEERHPEACIIDLDYTGMSLLGFDSTRVAGGVRVNCNIQYQQCRTNPEFPVCGGAC